VKGLTGSELLMGEHLEQVWKRRSTTRTTTVIEVLVAKGPINPIGSAAVLPFHVCYRDLIPPNGIVSEVI